MQLRPIILLILISTLIISCSEDQLNVDVSHVEVDLQTSRLDQDLFEGDFSQPDELHQQLYQKFGNFYNVYLEEILQTGPGDRVESLLTAEDFVRDVYMHQTYEAIQEVHNPRIQGYNRELEDAFKHLKYYYPETEIPNIIYYHSGFNFGVYSLDNSIGVGLDWFLGKEHKITQNLPFPVYRKQKMEPQYLTVNVIKDWSNKLLYQNIEGENLLETLVYYGKIMYLVDALMPEVPDSIKMNWNSNEINWCKENEFRIWKELASDQSTLYDTTPFEVQKWVIDGPFTSGLPQESPGMAGVWIGWQMLKDHHARNPEAALNEILAADAATIIRSYNPKK